METIRDKLSLKLQNRIAIASFIAALLFAIAGFFCPPKGEIHSSVLYLIAQFLLLTSSMFGISSAISAGTFRMENKAK